MAPTEDQLLLLLDHAHLLGIKIKEFSMSSEDMQDMKSRYGSSFAPDISEVTFAGVKITQKDK